MFLGHYGLAFFVAGKKPNPPLSLCFLSTSLLDILCYLFVFLGIEEAKTTPGFTESFPYELASAPFSHGLLASVVWGSLVWILFSLCFLGSRFSTYAGVLSLLVFSHFPTDWLVHGPDLAIIGNRTKIGLGLWNFPLASQILETAIFLIGVTVYLFGFSLQNKIGWSRIAWFSIGLIGVNWLIPFLEPLELTRSYIEWHGVSA